MSRGTVKYRFLRLAQPAEEEFDDVRAAVDAACRDLAACVAVPLEIATDGEVVLTTTDICEMCDPWVEWAAGRGAHPLTEGYET